MTITDVIILAVACFTTGAATTGVLMIGFKMLDNYYANKN